MHLPASSTWILALTTFASVHASNDGSAQQDRWTLKTTTDFDPVNASFTLQPYVSNGYIGQRLPVEGHGYSEITPNNATGMDGTQGWPLFTTRATQALVAGFYDQQENTTGTNFEQIGGQQPIATIPTWSSLWPTIANASYGVGTPASQISNWTQSLSIQDGVVKTSLHWKPPGLTAPVELKYKVFAHRTQPNLGVVRLDINGLQEGTIVSLTDVLDGAGSWRTTFAESGILTNYTNTIYTAVQPVGISNVTAYETSVVVIYPFTQPLTRSDSCIGSLLSTNESTISQCYTLSAPASGSISAIKYVGISSSDAFPGDEFRTALHSARHANATGFVDVLNEHQQAWSEVWDNADIVIPGEEHEELQLATRASLFHLLTNVREGSEPTGLGDNSIAPAGLASDSYAGQIFWDAETWMSPSLVALFPSYAESIINFRYRQLGAAKENAKQFNRTGLLYPWTSGRFGNCTGVGPCYDYEYHLNNDIALLAYQYYAGTQNKTWLEEEGWPIVSAVAEFWAGHVVYNTTTDRYDTFNETDPDEYANFKDNAAFTNAGISVLYKQAQELADVLGVITPSNWTEIGQKITVLEDPTSGIILEYEGFNGSVEVKQADVVLLTYPLEYEQSATQALIDLDFYSLATSAEGPGMTYSIFSIDASALSSKGCAAWTYALAGSQPYNRAPFYQFSEQTTDNYATNGGTNPAFTFLTGHGGFLQTLTHGFTGHRSRLHAFYLDPILPPQLSNYTLKGMKYGDSSFDVTVATDATTVYLRSGSSDSVDIEVGSANAKGGNYTLKVGEYLTIPTRKTSGPLVEGNMAQCLTVLANDTSFVHDPEKPVVVPGQYALAAIDGSNATTWQPATNKSSSMIVDLGVVRNISAFHFNWQSNPPLTYAVYGGIDSSSFESVAAGNITLSAPYDPATADRVEMVVGNLTDVKLPSIVAARYVKLAIEGSYMEDGYGGLVAEFAVL